MKLLDALYPDGDFADHTVALFELPSRKVTQHATPAELYAASAVVRGNAYFTIGLQPDGLVNAKGYPRRAEAHEVLGIPGFWLDADLETAGKKKRHFRTERDLLQFLDRLPLAPSLLVRTGGGLHAYWRFEEPWLFDSEAERQQAEAMSRGWQAFVRAEAKERGGFEFDSTYDLARVLRVDGTPNVNRGNFIVEVIDDRRRFASNVYNPSDFEMWQQQPRRAVDLPDVEMPQEVVDEDLERIKEALRILDTRFEDTWNRRRGKELNDASASGYCMSLANMAARAELSDQEITSLLYAWRVQNGFDPKHPKFYASTIAKARALVKSDDITAEIDIAIATGDHATRDNGAPIPKDDEQRNEWMVPVRTALGDMPLQKIVRYGDAAEPTYALFLDPPAKDADGKERTGGAIIVGGTTQFMRQQSWREALVRNLMPPFTPLKGADWNRLFETITKLVEVHETHETSEVGVLVGWINALRQSAVDATDNVEAKHAAIADEAPFTDGLDLYFNFQRLFESITRRGIDRIGRTDLQGRLERFCGESQRVEATHEGSRARRWYYRVRLDQLEEPED